MADFESPGVFIFTAANGVTARSSGYGFPAGRNTVRARPTATVQAPLQARLYTFVRPIKQHLVGLFEVEIFSPFPDSGPPQNFPNRPSPGLQKIANTQALVLRGPHENPLVTGAATSGGGGSTRPSSGLLYPRLIK